MMNWKRYRVQAGLSWPIPEEECVVEAPSPGLALEFYLASHGMMGYNYSCVEETDADSSAHYDQAEFLALYGPRVIDLERLAVACDQAHKWQPFPEND
jgi:hypothetical protein